MASCICPERTRGTVVKHLQSRCYARRANELLNDGFAI
jgi:hypothetical protein